MHKFGIELEFKTPDGFNDLYDYLRAEDFNIIMEENDYNYFWTYKEDGSLEDDDDISDGVEIVSKPLTLTKKNLNQIHRLCSVLEDSGCYTNESCGFHVHVDVSFIHSYTDRQQRQFFKHIRNLYANYENVFDSRINSNRSNDRNPYCWSMNNPTIDFDSCRYTKLNTCSYIQHGTIEFRHHHGTIDSYEIINWVKTCLMFVEFAKMTFIAAERKMFELDISYMDALSQTFSDMGI